MFCQILTSFFFSIFRVVNWTIAWGRASKMGDQQNEERIPKENEVEELEKEKEGESLSMRFLALAVSHTVPSSNRQRHSEVDKLNLIQGVFFLLTGSPLKSSSIENLD